MFRPLMLAGAAALCLANPVAADPAHRPLPPPAPNLLDPAPVATWAAESVTGDAIAAFPVLVRDDLAAAGDLVGPVTAAIDEKREMDEIVASIEDHFRGLAELDTWARRFVATAETIPLLSVMARIEAAFAALDEAGGRISPRAALAGPVEVAALPELCEGPALQNAKHESPLLNRPEAVSTRRSGSAFATREPDPPARDTTPAQPFSIGLLAGR